jgi:hypothetical protein
LSWQNFLKKAIKDILKAGRLPFSLRNKRAFEYAVLKSIPIKSNKILMLLELTILALAYSIGWILG